MSVTSLFSTPWGILLNKKAAKLTGGAITRGATVRPAQRSRHNPLGADATTSTPLGLGYVEALLGVLLGIVGTISYDAGAERGRVAVRSTGGPTVYAFSWKAEAGRVVLGGFSHSEGQPTYQAAIIGLAQLVALHRCRPSPQSEEVVARWYMLVDAMEATYPRTNQDAGWPGRTLAAAAANPALLPHIEGVADALYHAMRYDLSERGSGAAGPRLVERGLVVTTPDVLAPGEGRATTLPGSVLINPAGATAPTPGAPLPDSPTGPAGRRAGAAEPPVSASPPPAPTAPRSSRRATRAARTMAETPPAPPPPAAPRLYGAHLTRVQRAVATAPGPLMLVGPTATDKTTLALAAARALGWGAEVMVCDPGMDDQEPIGGYARTTSPAPDSATAIAPAALSGGLAATSTEAAADRLARAEARLDTLYHRLSEAAARTADGWAPIDGPISRWARRAIAGERVLLVIDELARGHESLIATVMRVLNTFDRDAVERQGLRVPDGATCGAFHVIDVWHTRERLIVPAEHVKIIATANLGDRYGGLDLADPAFRRRWSGGWLYLGAYPPDTLAAILADRLGLPPTAPLIANLTTVAARVEEYQRAEDKLIATLDLATLITWGQAVVRLSALPGISLVQAWAEAASDVWVERVCPTRGAELDPDVRAQLLRAVAAHAPASPLAARGWLTS